MNIKGRALKVGIATIVAQIFSALGFVAIPKFFSASDYGELVLILGIVSILQPIATMRIEILTSVVDSDKVSQFLIGFVKRLSALVSLGCFILSFLYFYLIRGNVWQESARIGLFISCITLFQSLSIILVQINLRNQRIRPIAFSGVMQNSSTLVLQILFGMFKLGSTFLITAYLLGRIIGIIPLNVSRNNMKKEEILTQDKYMAIDGIGTIDSITERLYSAIDSKK
jgi:O-antigen/teichoic acid export membrane protein